MKPFSSTERGLFVRSWPATLCREQRVVNVEEPQEQETEARKTILIVDDDPTILNATLTFVQEGVDTTF